MSDTLTQLSRRFPAKQVKTRSQGGKQLHYIDIPETIKRFNEVLGFGYSFTVDEIAVNILTGETTSKGRQLYRADVRGHITIGNAATSTWPAERGGVGSDTADDVDKALKTAQAEAFKKAGHQFGVGLYLWDERERQLVNYVNAEDWKMSVQLLAQIEGATLTAAGIAEHFTVELDELQDEAVQQTILVNAGLL